MFFFYQILISIIIIISPFIILFRLINKKEDLHRFKEKFCFFTKKRNNGKLVWFHGASVGEIISIIPLINELEKNESIKTILVTSTTLSSSNIIKKYSFKKVIHQFYPIDHYFFTNKFLNYWKPNLAVFIESEIWPSMFISLKKKSISLVLLNARIRKRSFLRWFKLNKFSNFIFSKIDFAYPQNYETKYFLKKLGVKKIFKSSNLKFIENKLDKDNEVSKSLQLKFKKYKIWTAASTHFEEEKFIGKTHILLKKLHKNLITIIIPRHIDKIEKIISDLEKLNLKILTHSSKKKKFKNVDIYIVDTYGDTKKFFKLSPTVFMGKSTTFIEESLKKNSGQNPIEAAQLGAKVLHGPFVENFNDVYKKLTELKITKKINNSKDIIKEISFKKSDKSLKKFKKLGKLILFKTKNELVKILNNEI